MYRNRLSFLRHDAAFIGLACLCGAASSFAQSTPAQQQQQPADPFVKGPAKPAAPVAQNTQPPPLAPTWQFGLATIGIPMQEYQSLIEKSANSAAMYQRAKELLANGQGSLEDVESITTHIGQRARVTSVDELPVPQKYSATTTTTGGQAVPSEVSRLDTGYTWEMEPITLPGQPGSEVNLAFEHQRLLRFTEWKAGGAAQSQWLPEVEDRRQTLAVLVPDTSPQYIGTISHSEGNSAKGEPKVGQTISLLFLRAQNAKDDEAPAPPAANSKAGNLRITCTVYSMDRGLALNLLMDGDATGNKLHEEVLKQVHEHQASLEKIATLLTRSSQRTALDESTRFPFPADPSSPDSGKTSQHVGKSAAASPGAFFNEFITRPLGWQFEAEPVLDQKSGLVDLSVMLTRDEFRGNLPKPTPNLPDQPVFGSQKIVTGLTVAVGRHALLGAFNPPHNTGVNGREDDGKVWLAFVNVTLD